MKITNEIIEEIKTLAEWDGCETGDYCFSLLYMRESYMPTYSSDEFAKALDIELTGLYNSLKEFKKDEDELTAELSYADKRNIALNKLTVEDKKILGLI